MIRIRTKRLVLREPTPHDFAVIHEMRTDDRVAKFAKPKSAQI
jgi:RimJ/RimL family protein N-acetyltransferase